MPIRSLPLRAAAALALAASTLLLAPAAAQAGDPTVDVSGVQAAGGRVWLVAEVNPLPVPALTASGVQVVSAGSQLAAEVAPVISDRSAVTLVLDASAQAAGAAAAGGLSGVTGFLLQAPSDATVAVVEDRTPPAVVAKPQVGVGAAVTATSNLLSGGARSTSAAITLALRQAPAGTQPVVVLYTSARDAGGEPAPDLAERLRAVHAVLAVMTTSPDLDYWSRVATSTGGLAVSARPARSLPAFDQLADALRARYAVSFPRPTLQDRPVNLRVTTADGSATATVGLPAEPSAPAAQPIPAPAAGSGSTWWVWVLLGLLAVAAAAAVWWWYQGAQDPVHARAGSGAPAAPAPLQRQPEPKPKPESKPQPEPEQPPALPGVRVFDVGTTGAPREITGSLFEPRASRDAREKRSAGDKPSE